MLELFKFIFQAKAQTDLLEITPPTPPTSNFEGTGISDPGGILSTAITRTIEIAAGLLVIAIVYSGIMYITSGGDTTKAENAKKNLIWAIIGLVVILLVFVIIDWVQFALNNNH